MKVGQFIKILPSCELSSMSMDDIVGRKAIITSILKEGNGDIHGCWCELSVPWNDEIEWFIPYNSILIL